MNEELTILLQHLLLHNTLIILVNVNINILRTSRPTLLKSKVVFLTLVNALSSKLTLPNN